MYFLNWPELKLENWIDTKITLHLYLQILGKIRLGYFPVQQHFWHAPLLLTANGVTTGPLVHESGLFELKLDLVNHKLIAMHSNGETYGFAVDRLTVSEFYKKTLGVASKMGIELVIDAKPYDPSRVRSDIEFIKDTQPRAYDKDYLGRFWYILTQIYPLMEQFKGLFVTKVSPVFLYWQTLDLACSIYTGNQIVGVTSAVHGKVFQQTYSHEMFTIGFWVGDDYLPEPVFYIQPNPEYLGLLNEPLFPQGASWLEEGQSMMGIYKYHDCGASANPKQGMVEFFQSGYLAISRAANWFVEELV
jgi:hypothetical protein